MRLATIRETPLCTSATTSPYATTEIHMIHRALVVVIGLLSLTARAADPADPLASWRTGVNVHPVSTTPDRHTIHSYYLTNPESPDGSRILFFSSTQPDGQFGDVRVLD